MADDVAKILSHVPNSGIVQMPGRRFPGIVMQGDSLSIVFDRVAFCLQDAKTRRDEETYFEVLMFGEGLQAQLVHYEETLLKLGMSLPYTRSIKERLVRNEYDA
jgi:hypothetical protein